MDRDRLIALVREQHGITLAKDDPVLATVALNDMVLGQALARVEKATAAAGDQLAATFVQAEAAAKQVASTIITDASAWCGDQVREAMREAGAAVLAELRAETAKAEGARRGAIRAAWVAGGASVVALAALAGVVLAGVVTGH